MSLSTTAAARQKEINASMAVVATKTRGTPASVDVVGLEGSLRIRVFQFRGQTFSSPEGRQHQRDGNENLDRGTFEVLDGCRHAFCTQSGAQTLKFSTLASNSIQSGSRDDSSRLEQRPFLLIGRLNDRALPVRDHVTDALLVL